MYKGIITFLVLVQCPSVILLLWRSRSFPVDLNGLTVLLRVLIVALWLLLYFKQLLKACKTKLDVT